MSSTERPDWRDRAHWPDPTADSGPTRWTNPASDYATAPDGSAPWSAADAPANVPPAIEPPTERIGWLAAGRSTPGPDGA